MKNEKKDNTALMTPGFHGDTALDENGRMKGIYVPMAGVSCAYSLIVQDATIKPPPYAVRGSVKLLTPSGQIFKSKARPSVSATARKKEEDPLTRQPPNSIHVQKKSINSHSTNAEDLKQAIIKNSRKLVEENAKYLRSELDKQTRVKELCFSLVHQMNTRRYLSSLNERGMATSEDAQHRRELHIKKLADSELGVVGIADITDAMLNRVKKQIGKNWREYFKEAADLLTFALVRKHQFEGNNCFEAYLEAHPEQKKRDTKKLQQKASGVDILTIHKCRMLMDHFFDTVADGEMVGACLVFLTGFPAAGASELTWKRITFLDDGYVRIEYRQDDKAGRVHDYSFLISPLGARFLKKRKEFLEKNGYDFNSEGEHYVASAANDPAKKLPPEQLTALCRRLAKEYGISYAVLAGLKDTNTGAGIKVFRNTRENLLRMAGMKDDPALLKFYCHESLVNNTQANNYRDLCGPTAQHVAKVYLERADRMLREPTPCKGDRVERQTSANEERVAIHPEDSSRRANGEVKIYLHAGETIRFAAKNGVRVAAKACRVST